MNANEVCYACTFVEKTAEVDDFEKGCIGKFTTVMAQPCNVSTPTLKELIAKLEKEFFLDMSYLFIAEHDQPVEFIGCNQLETADGNTPDEQEKEMWKKGETTLYLCDYTFHVERRIVSPIDFSEFEELQEPDRDWKGVSIG